MPLDKEIMEKIRNKLSEKISNWTCTSCNHNDWIISDRFLTISLTDDPYLFPIGGTVIPLITLTCKNCGNTRFHNLITLGVCGEIVEYAERHKPENKKIPIGGGGWY